MNEASCGTVCAGVRRCCLYNKFSGALIGIRRGRGALIEKSTCYPRVLIGYKALIRIFTVIFASHVNRFVDFMDKILKVFSLIYE